MRDYFRLASLFLTRDRIPTLVFRLIIALSLLLMMAVVPDYGITLDEIAHRRYSKEVLYPFYFEGWRSFEEVRHPLDLLYGGFFLLIAEISERVAPSLGFGDIPWYDIRHVPNAFFGWLGVLFTGLLARRCFGTWAGILAIVLLMLTPRYFGHSMNNPKDIPFAALFVASLYALTFIRRTYPYVTAKILAGIVAAIALTINVRVGGILLICYAGALVGWYSLHDSTARTWRRTGAVAGVFLASAALTVMLGTVFWPWALQSPLLRPFEALRLMSSFPQSLMVLYDGEHILSDQIPRSYLPHTMLITIPLSILAGILLALWSARHRERRLHIFALIFAFAFPVFYIVVLKSQLSDGMRHVLFVLPPMAVVAAAGWEHAIRWLTQVRPWFGIAAAAVLIVFLYSPARYSIVNHPHQVTYYNEIIGGAPGAFLVHEMDYYGNCAKQAFLWVKSQHKHRKTIRYISNRQWVFRAYAEPPRLRQVQNRNYADYEVLFLRNPDADETRAMLQSPDLVHIVSADGVPLCVVLRVPRN